MSNTKAIAALAMQLARERATLWGNGMLRRDPNSLLRMPAGKRDPYPLYERMRAAGPLTSARNGEWVSTSHPLCNQVLRDRNLGVREESTTPTANELDLSMLDRNPPEHTRLRRLAMPAFSPKVISGYRARVEKVAHSLLDATTGEFDLITDFAAPLPISVITELLGIPDAEVDRFFHYGSVIGSALDGVQSLRHARALIAASQDMDRLFSDLIDKRRADPGDDIISMISEGSLTSTEMVDLCQLLLVAGFETTENLIGNGVFALLQNPDQWAALIADPQLAPSVVEEVLRYDSPVQRTGRVAFRDVQIGDHRFARNEWVVTLLGAANRDPDVFADPNRFDVNRENASEHLAFSGGIHYCLGAPLARLEGGIAFQILAERMPRLRQAGRISRRPTITIRGLRHLPVRG